MIKKQSIYQNLSLKTLKCMLNNELDRFYLDKIDGLKPDLDWVYNLVSQIKKRRESEKA